MADISKITLPNSSTYDIAGMKVYTQKTLKTSGGTYYISGLARDNTYEQITCADGVYFTGAGTVYAKGFGSSSARKFKENIAPTTTNATDLINSTDIVDFTYINDEEHNQHIGFIADDTDALMATKTHDAMDITNCIGVLLKAVQELSARITDLETEVKELKEKA